MITISPLCSECKEAMKWSDTTFVYEDDGIEVQVPDVPAWVCPRCGEVSFTPEVTDRLIGILRELVEMAKETRKRQPLLREYRVKVA